MSSTVTGNVVSLPWMTMPSESPTSSTSAPASSSRRANVASYAVSTVIRSPRSFMAFKVWMVTFEVFIPPSFVVIGRAHRGVASRSTASRIRAQRGLPARSIACASPRDHWKRDRRPAVRPARPRHAQPPGLALEAAHRLLDFLIRRGEGREHAGADSRGRRVDAQLAGARGRARCDLGDTDVGEHTGALLHAAPERGLGGAHRRGRPAQVGGRRLDGDPLRQIELLEGVEVLDRAL